MEGEGLVDVLGSKHVETIFRSKFPVLELPLSFVLPNAC